MCVCVPQRLNVIVPSCLSLSPDASHVSLLEPAFYPVVSFQVIYINGSLFCSAVDFILFRKVTYSSRYFRVQQSVKTKTKDAWGPPGCFLPLGHWITL